MTERRHLKQLGSFRDRFALFAKEAREQASNLPEGPEKDGLLMKVRQAAAAIQVDDWTHSPGLPPTSSWLSALPSGEFDERHASEAHQTARRGG